MQFWSIVKCLMFEVECVCANGVGNILFIRKFNCLDTTCGLQIESRRLGLVIDNFLGKSRGYDNPLTL